MNAKRLIAKLAEEEQQFTKTVFAAPCVLGGKVRARVAGVITTFTPEAGDFEGWGIFQAADSGRANLVTAADLPVVAAYMELMTPIRLLLAQRLRNRSWLAYPMNESDFGQRVGPARPVTIHLVEGGTAFEPIVARWDGSSFWFEDTDRRADPVIPTSMRESLRRHVLPDGLRTAGLTPEHRTVYEIAAVREHWYPRAQLRVDPAGPESAQRGRRTVDYARFSSDSARLGEALRSAGGQMDDFRDQGDYWQVEWRTRDGQIHSSAISKADLTVVSSGVCLSGMDNHFDLQSLVGVMEQRPDWHRYE